MKDQTRELTATDFEHAIPRRLRDRLGRGDIKSGEDVAALRRFLGLSQEAFAVVARHQRPHAPQLGAGPPYADGPALALLRIAARHTMLLGENVAPAG